MNTPVNFEIAKLLKEKGIIIKPLTLISETEYVEGYSWDIEDKEDYLKVSNFQFEDNISRHLYLKPTVAEVVMWLYEKHSVWISVDSQMKVKSDWRTLIPNSFSFGYSIRPANEKDYLEKYNKPIIVGTEYSSPTEAYQAGIEHTLNNLL